MLIAAVLVALKASGAAIGWGIQFQWPWFIAAMAAVTVLFAASLWGWLPILLPRFAYQAAEVRGPTPYAEAFLTGAFATLLATPCSAPFVGTAVGFALAQGPAEIATVFGALGVGMAAPYLAVAGFPQLVRLLPRPGRWMNGLRVVLGFALAGTAIWLLFVLAALSGPRTALATAAALAVVLALLALKSRAGHPGGRRPARGLGHSSADCAGGAVARFRRRRGAGRGRWRPGAGGRLTRARSGSWSARARLCLST